MTKLQYRVVENPTRKMTSVMVGNGDDGREALVAFWNWRLTGRQSAFIAATRLRDSRQRMADAGKPMLVEAELLSGPLGGKPKKSNDQLALNLPTPTRAK